MIITFCGHSNFSFNDATKDELNNLLIEKIRKNPTCKFYLGGYGDFDRLCLSVLRELKKNFQTLSFYLSLPILIKIIVN